MTSLNLFTTKFSNVLDLLEKRKTQTKYMIFDTPGQIEVFTWSASGTIITEALVSACATVTDLLEFRTPLWCKKKLFVGGCFSHRDSVRYGRFCEHKSDNFHVQHALRLQYSL